jgi:hypothetical protein
VEVLGMNKLDLFRYTGFKARVLEPYLYLKKILCFFKKNYRCAGLEEFVNFGKRAEKIVVVGAGPSSKKIEFDPSNLYITTNSSYLVLPDDATFIHVLNDLSYLRKYLVFGLKIPPKKVYIYAPFINKNNFGYKVMQLSKELIKCTKDHVEIVSQSKNLYFYENRCKGIYEELERLNNSFDVKNHGGNSGLMILNFGLLLSKKLDKELHIYGLDAGEGGKVYFDGRKITNNHIAFRDEHKQMMGNFLEYITHELPNIYNHSYFKNNVDNA